MQERPPGSMSLVGSLARSQAKNKRVGCSFLNTVALIFGPNINSKPDRPMSPGAIYLRDRAARCRAHAASLGDAETQAALLKLANEYIVQAEQIESEENTATIDGGIPA